MSMNCKPRCAKFVVLVVLGAGALGWIVMVLWNWLVPTLFVGKEIGYLQALGLLLLSRILFGGLRGCGSRRWHRERWERMTPEERERFETGMRRCFDGREQPATKPEDGDRPQHSVQ